MKWVYSDGGRKESGYKGITGDCVVRAISIATQKSYVEVYQSLENYISSLRQTKKVRNSASNSGLYKTVYHRYLISNGWEWYSCMGIGTGCKVHMREEELPGGRIIVRLSGHLACVVDGKVYDTHDCTRDGTRCVYGYYRKKGVNDNG